MLCRKEEEEEDEEEQLYNVEAFGKGSKSIEAWEKY